MSIRVTPASSAAWIARIDCSSGGLPDRAIGIAPSPIGNTSVPASLRVFVSVVVMATTFPRPGVEPNGQSTTGSEPGPLQAPRADYPRLTEVRDDPPMQHRPDERQKQVLTTTDEDGNERVVHVKLPPGMRIDR